MAIMCYTWENTEIGVDSSQSMIKRAQEQYPKIEFMVCDALALPFNRQFDVVNVEGSL